MLGTAAPTPDLPPPATLTSLRSEQLCTDLESPVFNLDDDIPDDALREEDRQVTRYPGVGDTEEVLWAGWDALFDSERSKPRSVSRRR